MHTNQSGNKTGESKTNESNSVICLKVHFDGIVGSECVVTMEGYFSLMEDFPGCFRYGFEADIKAVVNYQCKIAE